MLNSVTAKKNKKRGVHTRDPKANFSRELKRVCLTFETCLRYALDLPLDHLITNPLPVPLETAEAFLIGLHASAEASTPKPAEPRIASPLSPRSDVSDSDL